MGKGNLISGGTNVGPSANDSDSDLTELPEDEDQSDSQPLTKIGVLISFTEYSIDCIC